MNKNQKGLAPIIIILIVVAILAGGILAWQCGWISKTPTPTPTSTPTPTPTPTSTPDETADWKTYTNEEYGFEVKYPDSWIIDEKTYNTVKPLYVLSLSNKQKFKTGRIEIDIQSTTYPSILSWAKEAHGPHGLQEVKVGKEEILGQQFIEKKKIFTGLLKNNFLYQIILFGEIEEPKKSEIETVYNQILSTFKFLDETANWKTYQSPDGAIRAQIIPVGKTQESKIQILTNEGVLLQEADYSSEDGDHGFKVVLAEWTPNSQFFIYSTESLGGHQPWFSPVYFYNKSDNKIYSFTEVSGFTVANGEFIVAAPDIVTFTVYTSPGMGPTITKSFKLGDLISE